MARRAVWMSGFAALLALWSQALASEGGSNASGDHALSEVAKPLAKIPGRPHGLVELGEPFLGTGTLAQGIHLPTGAIWQPSLLVFGTMRSALQTLDPGSGERSEWVNRLDLFGNLYLTQTERVLAGFRPLDRDGRFSGYRFEDGAPTDFQDGTNFEVQTLFFEGDLGEIFPFLDRSDRRGLDYGIAVGRQTYGAQDGMLINDDLDAVGLTRANLKPPGMVNLRVTGFWAWKQVDRPDAGGNTLDADADLFGLFTEGDWRSRTMELDLAYVDSKRGGNGLYGGLSAIQQSGAFNSAIRIMGSMADGDETARVRNGALVFGGFSMTPRNSVDLVYLDAFWGIDKFRSAARSPTAGGPLGQTGILFAAVGIGRYGAALSNQADDAVGGALGYQKFFGHTRQQLVFEIGGRYPTETDQGPKSYAGGARFQTAAGRRFVIVLEGFAGEQQQPGADSYQSTHGGRFEIVLKL